MAVALLLAPAAHAASLRLSASAFSPVAGPMTLEGQIGAPKKLGVRLANTRGRPLGWLERPKLRSDLLVVWNGRLNGKQLPDGYYQAQLVAGGVVVARTLFRIDTQPALLQNLRVSNGAPAVRRRHSAADDAQPEQGQPPTPGADPLHPHRGRASNPRRRADDRVDRRDLHTYVDAARGPAHAGVEAGAGARRAHVRPLTDDAGQRVERPHLRLTGSARRAPPACAGRAPDRR